MSKPRWWINLLDFFNMVKSFLAINYLSTAYAYRNSGLVPGVVLMLFIAFLTNHCCHLIVKTKHRLIEKATKAIKGRQSDPPNREANVSTSPFLCYNGEAPNPQTAVLEESHEYESDTVDIEEEDIKEFMLRHMTYGDVGNHCYGNAGVAVVNFFIAMTQFGFCVNYFIFIGNTLERLFPVEYCYTNPQTHKRVCGSDIYNNTANVTQNNVNHFNDSRGSVSVSIASALSGNSSSDSWHTVLEGQSTSPSLIILVASPAPIFIVFILIRSVRYLGPTSIIATITILVGIVSTLVYLVTDFTVSGTSELASWSSVSVFFGIVTANFEGIALVIPVESSMVGNRHLFPCFLSSAIMIITSVLGGFGILGYLRFGRDTDQLLNSNIPQDDPLGKIVNITICIGILMTYPLMVFPVVEIVEKYLFTAGRICGPIDTTYENKKESEDTLLLSGDDQFAGPDVTHVPNSVAAWKRNTVRVVIVLVGCGLAILLRNYFAYVIALIGALGSSVLAYILPCLFHLKICGRDISRPTKVKDGAIIVFGVVASVICVAVVINQMLTGYI